MKQVLRFSAYRGDTLHRTLPLRGRRKSQRPSNARIYPLQALTCPDALLRGCCDNLLPKAACRASLASVVHAVRRLLLQAVPMRSVLSRMLRGGLLLPQAVPGPMPAARRRLLHLCGRMPRAANRRIRANAVTVYRPSRTR